MPCQIAESRIVEALEKCGGFIQLAADEIGCSRQMFYDRAKHSQRIRDAITAARERHRESFVKRAETAISNLLEENHYQAAELTLSRLGKDRGWAPDRNAGSANVHISFEVEHLIPDEYVAALAELQGSQQDTSGTLLIGQGVAGVVQASPSSDEED